jgi:hypothetical protein
MQHLPSNIDFLGEDEGTHDGHNDHHEGAEGRGEDWASNLDHQPLHVVGDARRHYALCTHAEILDQRCLACMDGIFHGLSGAEQ